MFRYLTKLLGPSTLHRELLKPFKASEKNFEIVLRKLWQAKLVNRELKIPEGRVDDAYREVHTEMIATVRDTHVSFNDALPHLAPIYNFLRR
jgi:hypothetical protein